MQRFGEKVRVLRQRRGWTLRELAAALGHRSHAYINLIEIGQRKPNLELVMSIARLFDVTPDLLLRDELELDSGQAP
ncbi:MAG: hypothetical protein OHK0022_25720 [Roseiflexaceae bacterium]